MLVEAQRRVRRDAVMPREPTRGAQHQIVAVEPGKRRRFRPAHRQRQRFGRRRGDLVADIGEGDEAVEQVIAVGPPADDVEEEVDLGGGEDGDRLARDWDDAAQPPRSAGCAGAGGDGDDAGETGASPLSSLAWIGAISSLSGLNCSARRH